MEMYQLSHRAGTFGLKFLGREVAVIRCCDREWPLLSIKEAITDLTDNIELDVPSPTVGYILFANWAFISSLFHRNR